MKKKLLVNRLLKKIICTLLLLALIVPAFSQGEQELSITNLVFPGTGEVICLVNEENLTLDFEATGDFPEGTEFEAHITGYSAPYVAPGLGFFLGSIGLNEGTSIPLTFPENLVTEGDNLFYVVAVHEGEIIAESDLVSKEVYTEIDPDANELESITATDEEISKTYNSGDQILIGPDGTIIADLFQGVENIEYKLVNIDAENSVSDWKTTTISPVPLPFSVDNPEEGEYRFFARTVSNDGSVLCEDSVPTNHFFTVQHTFADADIFNPSIPGVEDVICLVDDPDHSLEFEQTGTFPEGTEIRVVAESTTDTITLGSIEAGTGTSIPLSLTSELGGAIYVYAVLNGDYIEQTTNLGVNIIPEIDPNVSINIEGDTSICSGDSVDIDILESFENVRYKVVHAEGDSSVTTWGTPAGISNNTYVSAPGTYKIFARSNPEFIGRICQDSVETTAMFTISHVSERSTTLAVRLDQIDQEPNAEGNYEFCPSETVALNAPNIQNANYFWYKNGELLESINTSATGIGVFEDETGNTGSGDYHVEIYPENQEDCPYISDTVSIVFPEAEITVEGNILTASEGLSYRWYQNGDLLENETGQTITVQESGDYSVEVEVLEDCYVMSDEAQVIVTAMSNAKAKASVNVFPNPANEQIFVEVNSANSGQTIVKVLDMAGAVMLEKTVSNSGKAIINSSSLTSGIYFIHVIENGNVTVEKVIKK